MRPQITLRTLYLPAGHTIDRAAAKAAATTLCRAATVDDLRVLIREEWIDWDTLPGSEHWPYALPDELLARLAGVLRAGAAQTLHRRLDQLATSLHRGDVARFRIDGPDGLDAFVTGGLDTDDAPTDAYHRWDVVFVTDPDRFPAGWAGRIGAAAGLLRLGGNGPEARTLRVTFHRWT
jgi:hypothetical protein